MDDLLLAALGSDSDTQLMVKSAELNWTSPAKYRDDVTVDAEVARWGASSFDVTYRMTVEGQALCEVAITYVHVEFADGVPAATVTPMEIRNALSSACNGS